MSTLLRSFIVFQLLIALRLWLWVLWLLLRMLFWLLLFTRYTLMLFLGRPILEISSQRLGRSNLFIYSGWFSSWKRMDQTYHFPRSLEPACFSPDQYS